MNDEHQSIDIYSRLGFSRTIENYAQDLPRLRNWSVKISSNGSGANVEMIFSTRGQDNTLKFEIPTGLSWSRNCVNLSTECEASLSEEFSNQFVKYKGAIDPCIGFLAGSALFFRQNFVPNLYISLLVMSIVSLYFGPSIFRSVFRYFNSHPFNEINELYKLMMESKDEAVMKKVEELCRNHKYMDLRSKLLGFSPYDKQFQLKYAFVNGYIAHQLKEYDQAEIYFARALSLVKSSRERFYVVKAYVNMLNDSGRRLDSQLDFLCNQVASEYIAEQDSIMLKGKFQEVLQSLSVHEEEKATQLFDKIRWSKFHEILYPNLAVTYYSLKQFFCLAMKSTRGDSNLDIETYFKQAMHYKDLTEGFRKECEQSLRVTSRLVSRYQ